MFFNFFKKRKVENEIEKLKEIMKNSFSNVKDDLNKISNWIIYLNEKDKDLDEKINRLQEEINEIKEFLAFSSGAFKQVFKQVFKHQTPVEGVQTPVQTGVQTPKINKKLTKLETKSIILQELTLMERAILWVLANTDLKLSCEDIARVLGKSENTVRGQINNLKDKWPQLINEIIEKNGKKRYYIDERTKELIFKITKTKKRVKISASKLKNE
ncbi:MAG: hypothetical protein QXL50_00005 [Candidatus Pacearchaeota archaeon]